MPYNIVVVGSSNTDMVVKTSRLPMPGETILGGEFVMVPGGKGANQAVAAAKLRGKVYFVARLGNDVFGDASIENFKREGVLTDFIVRDQHHPSGVALIFVDDRGENEIVVAPGSNGHLSPSDVDKAKSAISEAKVVVLQLEIPIATVEHTVHLAQSHNVPVILNPAPARKLSRDILERVTVLTPNETELQILTGCDTVTKDTLAESCKPLLDAGVKTVVVTIGREGAVIVTDQSVEHVPTFPVEAVDTTAAGDAFTGALACALAEGKGMSHSVRFANAAAALSVTKMGAQTSLANREEVERLLAEGETERGRQGEKQKEKGKSKE